MGTRARRTKFGKRIHRIRAKAPLLLYKQPTGQPHICTWFSSGLVSLTHSALDIILGKCSCRYFIVHLRTGKWTWKGRKAFSLQPLSSVVTSCHWVDLIKPWMHPWLSVGIHDIHFFGLCWITKVAMLLLKFVQTDVLSIFFGKSVSPPEMGNSCPSGSACF